MANVLLFTDNNTRNVSFSDEPLNIDYSTYASGAYALASRLRQAGYTVQVIPHCSRLSLAGVKQLIDKHKDDLVWAGLSTTLFISRGLDVNRYRKTWATTTDFILDTSAVHSDNEQRKTNPSLQVLWGGEEINLIADYLLEVANAPFLIGGAWVSSISSGNLGKLNDSVRIVTGNAELFAEETTRLLLEDKSNQIPLFVNNAQYDNVDFKNYRILWDNTDLIKPTDWLPIEIARGCAFNCAFCDYDRKSTHDAYKHPSVLRDELIKNYEMYGVTKYILVDDLYNDSKKKVRVLHDEVWSKLPFKPEWTSFMRLDMLWSDPESAEFIKASGARMGSFGIETLHDKAGSRVGKGLGKKRILEALSRLKEVWGEEILVHGLFIMGLPDEPEEHLLETINWLKTTDLLYSYSASPLWITPPAHKEFVIVESPIAANNDKYGITWLPNNNWSNRAGMTYQRAAELSKMAQSDSDRVSLSFSEYPELRKMGFSHSEIANFQSNNFIPTIRARTHIIENEITHKLQTLLK
jgi:hypothetical protein